MIAIITYFIIISLVFFISYRIFSGTKYERMANLSELRVKLIETSFILEKKLLNSEYRLGSFEHDVLFHVMDTTIMGRSRFPFLRIFKSIFFASYRNKIAEKSRELDEAIANIRDEEIKNAYNDFFDASCQMFIERHQIMIVAIVICVAISSIPTLLQNPSGSKIEYSSKIKNTQIAVAYQNKNENLVHCCA